MRWELMGVEASESEIEALDGGMTYRACLPSMEGEAPVLSEPPGYGYLWSPGKGLLLELVENGLGGSDAVLYEGATVGAAAAMGPSWTEDAAAGGLHGERLGGQAALDALLAGRLRDGWLVAWPDLPVGRGPGGRLADALRAGSAMLALEAAARREGMEDGEWALRPPSAAGRWAVLAPQDVPAFRRPGLTERIRAIWRLPEEARPQACAAFIAPAPLASGWELLAQRPGDLWDEANSLEGTVEDPRAARELMGAFLRGDRGETLCWRSVLGIPEGNDDLEPEEHPAALASARLPAPGWRGGGGLFQGALEAGDTLYCPELGLMVDFENPSGRPLLALGECPSAPEMLTNVALRSVRPREVLESRLNAGGDWEAYDVARADRADLVLDDLLGSLPATALALAAMVDDPGARWARGTDEIVRACREHLATRDPECDPEVVLAVSDGAAPGMGVQRAVLRVPWRDPDDYVATDDYDPEAKTWFTKRGYFCTADAAAEALFGDPLPPSVRDALDLRREEHIAYLVADTESRWDSTERYWKQENKEGGETHLAHPGDDHGYNVRCIHPEGRRPWEPAAYPAILSWSARYVSPDGTIRKREFYIVTPAYDPTTRRWPHGASWTGSEFFDRLYSDGGLPGAWEAYRELRDAAAAGSGGADSSYRVARDGAGPMLIRAWKPDHTPDGEYLVEFKRVAPAPARADLDYGLYSCRADRAVRGCRDTAEAAARADRWGGSAIPNDIGSLLRFGLLGHNPSRVVADLDKEVGAWCEAHRRPDGELEDGAAERLAPLLDLEEEALRSCERSAGLRAPEPPSLAESARAALAAAASQPAWSRCERARGITALVVK